MDENLVNTQAKNMTKAIFKRESGMDYNAVGDAGTSKGAGQWQPNTWKAHAKDVLGDENAPMTEANQNVVAQGTIRKLIKEGKNAAQIAAIWNSGSDKNWENKVGTTTINGQRIEYNVPKYVKDVTDIYQQYKAQTPNPTQEQSQPEQPQKDGFLKSLAKGIISPVATMAARPIQLGAMLAGATPEQIDTTTKNIAGDWVVPTPKNTTDVLKDVGRGAETVALGMPVGTIGGAAKAGLIAGAGQGLEETGTVGGTLKGGATGLALGTAGGAVSKVLSSAPKWLAKDAFKGLNDAQIEKVLATKHIGSTSSLLKQSQKATGEYGRQIDNILQKSTSRGAGNFSIRATVTQFPEFAGKEAKMLQKIKNLIPSGNDVGLTGSGWDRATLLSYMDKIADGTANLFEKNRVKQAINSATTGGYAKMAKAMQPSAGHDLAMTFANNLTTEIKKSAPATIPIFEEFAKEMAFKKAINKLAQKNAGGLIRWSDVIPFMAGSTFGGPIAGLGALAATRAAQSPATEFAVAKGIKGLGKVVKPIISRAGLLPVSKR